MTLPHVRERRRATLDHFRDETFDVLIIGGGITGAGIARDAALRGLRTALVERDDFASGTSSRSSRLVHGGVRYLEHGHLHLVFEASRERATLLRIAPHLVRPLGFTWPVYRRARVPRWKLAAGLLLYDLLALYRNAARHRVLGARQVAEREPRLRRQELVGGASYFDAATNDARLTLANAVSAAEAGAAVLNHAEVVQFVHERGRADAVIVRDGIDDQSVEVRSRVIVNATGPWSDVLRRLEGVTDGAGERTAVRATKGSHISVPADRVGNRGAVTLLSPTDARVMFVLPSGTRTIVGTTDTPTSVSPEEVRASEGDVAYLLRSVNDFFPDARLERRDVISAWAGIRPLMAAGYHDDPSSASREHAIARSASGVISVTGGKLTTYRSMSEEVVDQVERTLGRRLSASRTDAHPLPGGDRPLADVVARARQTVGDDETAAHLAGAYGTRWTRVWQIVEERPVLRQRLTPGLPYLAAECVYAVREEMALTLTDVLVRRTHLAFELADNARGVARGVADLMAGELGWTADRIARELDAFDRDAARIFAVDPS